MQESSLNVFFQKRGEATIFFWQKAGYITQKKKQGGICLNNLNSNLRALKNRKVPNEYSIVK